jgi:SAM-dependent methyltransferase
MALIKESQSNQGPNSLTHRKYVDIVIPTMWRAPKFIEALSAYSDCASVGQIILIDNDSSCRPEIPHRTLGKTKIICHGKNIFVNPAWNEGVLMCKSDIICIANDDILMSNQLFDIILALDWSKHQIDIIGLGASTAEGETKISKVSVSKKEPLGAQIPNFGACMFMPRKNYLTIPAELRIWYGDDFLVHANPGSFTISTPFVSGEMSTTIRSLGPHSEIHDIIRGDIAWARYNLLDLPDEANRSESKVDSSLTSNSLQTISLDLGCGTNPQNPFNANQVIGVDPQCQAPNILSFWVGFEPFPLEDSSVDFVTAYDFIGHIPRFALRDKPFNPFIDAMNEIWRVLKDNGTFFARTPAYPSAAAFQDPTHVNIITDQTISYFAKRPCLDGSLVDPWGPPLGKRYGFVGEFVLVKQWWETTHLCWKLIAIK